jgi:hypothetical protein
MTRQDDNICKRIESSEKFVPFSPFATTYGMGWKRLQAVRYRESPFLSAQRFSDCAPAVARKKRRHSGLGQLLR